jgi:hypothetical protein
MAEKSSSSSSSSSRSARLQRCQTRLSSAVIAGHRDCPLLALIQGSFPLLIVIHNQNQIYSLEQTIHGNTGVRGGL